MNRHGLTIAVIALAVAGYAMIAGTRGLARRTCERSMRISPELGAYYERHHVLTPATLAVYLRTIPRSC